MIESVFHQEPGKKKRKPKKIKKKNRSNYCPLESGGNWLRL
jgi:hypothetical protein